MAGKARFTWLHSVRREDILARRLSLTLRELSSEFLPPRQAIRSDAVCPSMKPEDDDEKYPEMTPNQKLGLELIKTAATFRGVCVAITSAAES